AWAVAGPAVADRCALVCSAAVPDPLSLSSPVFRFQSPWPTAIYPLSLHDALPISFFDTLRVRVPSRAAAVVRTARDLGINLFFRSEEHTSELQSRDKLECRLLLDKKDAYAEAGEDDRIGVVSHSASRERGLEVGSL